VTGPHDDLVLPDVAPNADFMLCLVTDPAGVHFWKWACEEFTTAGS
jgi:hypothetical protein